MNQDKQKEWEKLEEWKELTTYICGIIPFNEKNVKKFESFISSLLAQQRNEFIKEIEEKIERLPKYDLSLSGIDSNFYVKLTDITQAIKKVGDKN